MKGTIELLSKEEGVFTPIFTSNFFASKRRSDGREKAFNAWAIARAIERNRRLDGYDTMITVTSFRGTELICNSVINAVTGSSHLNIPGEEK